MQETSSSQQEVDQNNVGPISKAIENITRLRAKHLPLIQEKEKMVNDLVLALDGFAKWQEDVKSKQVDDAKFINLKEQIKDLDKIANYNIDELKNKLAKYKEQIERLRKRFERKTVQISLVGRARHGKSCILQAVTGLDNDTIPTSSETDCTGAISVIYNWDRKGEFEMDVEYYTPDEFIVAVNMKLEAFFGTGCTYKIHSLEQIASLPQDIFTTSEQKGFYNDYVARFNQYADCFSPVAKRHFESTNNVVEFVAKYKIFKNETDIPESYRLKGYRIEKREKNVNNNIIIDYKVHFANFVTIKKAVMSTHYSELDASNIVAVDTIGLGNGLTNSTDSDNMLKVLREDTDIAIFTYKIVPGTESVLPKFIKDTLDAIFGELSGLCPELWVTCLLNKYGEDAGEFVGDPNRYASYLNVVDEIYDSVASTGYGTASKELLTVCKTINALNKEEVNSQFILPVLLQITDKLPDIDVAMTKAVNECGKEVYAEVHALCSKLIEIKSSVLELNPLRKVQFKNNFKCLRLRDELVQLRDNLRKEREMGNPTISNDLKEQLDRIDNSIPSTDEMRKVLSSIDVFAYQIGVANIILNVYAKILKDLKDVSSKSISTIQQNVQNKVADIFFEYGLWNKLNIANAKDDIQPVERLILFTEQKLSEYPNLQQAIKSVLDFRMNIEGLLYSSCILQCETLKDFPSISPQMTKDEVVSVINSFLQSKVPFIRKELEYDFGVKKDIIGPKKPNLSLKMPNLLVWCLVDTFYQELASEECQTELESFYWEYQDSIWEEQVKAQTGMAEIVKIFVKALQCFVELDSEKKYQIEISRLK